MRKRMMQEVCHPFFVQIYKKSDEKTAIKMFRIGFR